MDEEEDVVVDPEIRIPLAPPRDPELFDSDAEFAEYRELEKASSWQHLPLFLVVLPPVGAIFWGLVNFFGGARVKLQRRSGS